MAKWARFQIQAVTRNSTLTFVLYKKLLVPSAPLSQKEKRRQKACIVLWLRNLEEVRTIVLGFSCYYLTRCGGMHRQPQLQEAEAGGSLQTRSRDQPSLGNDCCLSQRWCELESQTDLAFRNNPAVFCVFLWLVLGCERSHCPLLLLLQALGICKRWVWRPSRWI